MFGSTSMPQKASTLKVHMMRFVHFIHTGTLHKICLADSDFKKSFLILFRFCFCIL